MIIFESWADVREALDTYREKRLILSWSDVGPDLAVIGADMEEVKLRTLHAASLYLAGLASAECAYRDGKAQIGSEGEGS